MKQFFDTSVLLAAFVEDEPNHEACADAVATSTDSCVYSHALVEAFSLLTGGRLSVRLAARDASALIQTNLVEKMDVISLNTTEVASALCDAEGLGVRGGAIYDLLHLTAARKAKADEVLTLNVRHFRAFASDIAAKIRSP